jgi:hypothetical protein
MRETLDCGVLMVPAHASWMQAWMQRHGAAMSHIRLHAVELDEGGVVLAAGGAATAYAGAPAAAQFLARAAMSLRRFDACLLPVSPATLAWTRTALSCAGDGLHTPLVGVARALKAAAVEDLLGLGMRDFVRDPLCPEELRVRLDRVAAGKRVGGTGAPPASLDKAARDRHTGLHATVAESDDARRDARGPSFSLCEPGRHYAVAPPGRGDCRPRLPQDAIDHVLLSIQAAPRIHPDEPFRTAKSRVVDSFERDYVRTALSRHAGNVARAARASAKHRRAFWALMRKHHIDAAPYRPRLDASDGRFQGGGGGCDA